MKKEGNYIFVSFTNDYTPSWLWCLHDLVLSCLLSEHASDCTKTINDSCCVEKSSRDKT